MASDTQSLESLGGAALIRPVSTPKTPFKRGQKLAIYSAIFATFATICGMAQPLSAAPATKSAAPATKSAAPATKEAGSVAPLAKLRLQQQLGASSGRAGVGLHIQKDSLHLWSCEKTCRSAAAQLTLQVPEEASKLPRRVRSLTLRGGGRVLWVQFGSEERAYSVLLTGSEISEDGSSSAPVLVLKGWSGPKSKSGTSLVVSPTSKGQRLLLEGPEKSALCGRKVPSTTRLFDQKSARFRAVRVSLLEKKEREQAEALKARAGPASSAELLLRLDRTSETSAKAPVDADRSEPWGASFDYVELKAPAGVGLKALAFSVSGSLSSPAYLWLATDKQLYQVELSPSSEGLHFLDLPEEDEAKCVAILQPRRAAPISEVMVRVAVEKLPSLRGLIAQLSSADAGHAPFVLTLKGRKGASALAKSYPRMSRLARVRALEIAGEMPGSLGLPVLVAAVEFGGDTEREAAQLSLKAGGAASVQAMLHRLPKASESGEVHLTRALVGLSPPDALRVLAPRLGMGSPAERLQRRKAVARMSDLKEGKFALRRLVEEQASKDGLPRAAQVDLLRALRPHLSAWAPSTQSLVLRLSREATFEEAYRLAPLALDLAKMSPELSENFSNWLSGSQPQGIQGARKSALSVRALELLSEQEESPLRFEKEVRALLASSNFRVRRAAFGVLSVQGDLLAAPQVEDALEDDPWPQVRAAAAMAAGAFPRQSEEGQRLTKILSKRVTRDEHAMARRSMARALGKAGGENAVKALRKSLKKDDSYEVRAESAISLGKLCDHGSLDELTGLAQKLAQGQMGDGPILLGLAAVTALVSLNPSDLKKRLAPLLSEDVPFLVRSGVERRLSAAEKEKTCSASSI